MTLRARLLATLAGTAAVPILLFSWAVSERVGRMAGEEQTLRLAEAAAGLRRRLDVSRARLGRPLQRVAAALATLDEGAALGPSWSRLAENNGLDVLEAIGPDGRVLASHHWPAGYALPDDDRVLDERLGLRVQKLAQGHGFVERLTLTAEAEASWRGRPALLRGGVVVDDLLLADWGASAGVELALVSAGAGERWAARGSALASAGLPSLEAGASDGQLSAGGAALRWVALPLGPRLFALAAAPLAGPAAPLAAALARLSLAFAGLAALLGIAAALALSSGIVRPLERLSQASQRVAVGELSASVPVEGAEEIAELGRSFNEMVADLRKAQLRLVQAGRVAVWRDLARRLAHELKNPLFPIQISVETLRRAYEKERAGPGSPEFRKLFEDLTSTLLAELVSLRRIVEGFAGLARMPEPKLQPTDLNALAARVLDLQAARAGSVKIERQLAAELPLVPADPDLLSRALANLVANALEAMPDGGALTLATHLLARHAEIAVSDTGPGLDEPQRSQLFQPYYTTKQGGSGLGLVIAQSIVSDHRGELDVESAPGRGTTFRLRLPLAPST